MRGAGSQFLLAQAQPPPPPQQPPPIGISSLAALPPGTLIANMLIVRSALWPALQTVATFASDIGRRCSNFSRQVGQKYS
jgi:hypothetical protein